MNGPSHHTLLETLVGAWPALQRGLLLTLQLASIVVVVTLFAGVTTALLAVYGPRWLRWIVRLYVDLIRGIPGLVMIFAVYYLLPITGLDLREFWAAALALSVFFLAHVTEVTRGAIQSVPKGQIDAGRSIGLTFRQRLAYVVFPQAAMRFLPPWMNVVVETIKGTALVSLLGIVDLMMATQQVVARTFEAMLFYVVAAAIYVAINTTLSAMSRRLERRFAYLER